ncbi:MAG TPA: SRPBCC family protein [Phycisphaerales bacterium]|nr:SRPBCC family protein [Phycisphaerales bacterium]
MRAAELNFNPSEDSDQQSDHAQQNVGHAERALSAIGGGWLALKGLRRGGVSGVLIALAGAALVKRGVTGHCQVKQMVQEGRLPKLGFGQLGFGQSGFGQGREAKPADYFNHGIHVEEAVTVQAPAAQVYAFWRDFTNLAQFMKHVKSVEVLDEKRSHWVVEGPAGKDVEWDAEIINEEEGRLISWKSLPGAEVDNTGTVQFREAPAGRGTEVRVVLEYLPPAGKLGLAIAKAFGKTPGAQVRDDLRRLRQIIETGEVPTTEGQPRGEGKRGRVQTSMVENATRMMGNTDQHKPNQGARFARSEDQEQNKGDSQSGPARTRKQNQEPVGHAGDSSEEGGGE